MGWNLRFQLLTPFVTMIVAMSPLAVGKLFRAASFIAMPFFVDYHLIKLNPGPGFTIVNLHFRSLENSILLSFSFLHDAKITSASKNNTPVFFIFNFLWHKTRVADAIVLP